ncbi:hypothetical protein [Nucisporomicrobium flavum]|uniref:hypothetical protein n=1 Tax=Nucisporomicrobium flavum TaxID=2785915 RepID=UPI0018F4B97A|nr:hypothetical protein [Nucisporomicrobium flavum]
MGNLLRRRLVAGVVGTVGLLLAGGCFGEDRKPVENTRDQVLTDYMSAVQAGDAARLREVSNPEFPPAEIDAAISRKIGAVGARRWVGPEVRWTELVTPEMAKATIIASDDAGHRIVDEVYVVVVDDRWCVSFGPDTAALRTG